MDLGLLSAAILLLLKGGGNGITVRDIDCLQELPQGGQQCPNLGDALIPIRRHRPPAAVLDRPSAASFFGILRAAAVGLRFSLPEHRSQQRPPWLGRWHSRSP